MKSKKSLVYGILSIIIVAASLAFAIVDAVVPLGVWTHPILNFLFGIFAGFGVMVCVMALKYKSPWFFFVSAILLGLALFYVLMQYLFWWLSIIIVIALWAIFGILSVTVAGNKTEEIALNKSPDYKNFEQRQAEKKAKEAEEEQPEKPLPEIKSFK